jgi:hypothetical protein
MFWFKKKKTILKCYTTDPFAYSFAKIDWGNNFLPGWFNNLPVLYTDPEGRQVPTLRACHGFKQLYKNSLIIPSWAHININISTIDQSPFFEWKTNTTFTQIESHPCSQSAGFLDENRFINFKILSPWYFNCSHPTQFLMSDPIWNRTGITDYSILPGIMDFKYQSFTNIIGVLESKDQKREINFNPGDPLVLLTPMIEEDIVLEHYLVTPFELQKYLPDLRVGLDDTINKYVTSKKFINKIDQQESKCPFGFKRSND